MSDTVVDKQSDAQQITVSDSSVSKVSREYALDQGQMERFRQFQDSPLENDPHGLCIACSSQALDKTHIPLEYTELAGFLDGYAKHHYLVMDDPMSLGNYFVGMCIILKLKDNPEYSPQVLEKTDFFQYLMDSQRRPKITCDASQLWFSFVVLNVKIQHNIQEWTMFPIAIKDRLIEFISDHVRLRNLHFDDPFSCFAQIHDMIEGLKQNPSKIKKESLELWKSVIVSNILTMKFYNRVPAYKDKYLLQSTLIEGITFHSYVGPPNLGIMAQCCNRRPKQSMPNTVSQDQVVSTDDTLNAGGHPRNDSSKKRARLVEPDEGRDCQARSLVLQTPGKKFNKPSLLAVYKKTLDAFNLELSRPEKQITQIEFIMYQLMNPHHIFGPVDSVMLQIIQLSEEETGGKWDLIRKLAFWRLAECNERKKNPNYPFKDPSHVINEHAHEISRQKLMRGRKAISTGGEGEWCRIVTDQFYGAKYYVTTYFPNRKFHDFMNKLLSDKAAHVTTRVIDPITTQITPEGIMNSLLDIMYPDRESSAHPVSDEDQEAMSYEDRRKFVVTGIHHYLSYLHCNGQSSQESFESEISFFLDLHLDPSLRVLIHSGPVFPKIFQQLCNVKAEVEGKEEARTTHLMGLISSLLEDLCKADGLFSEKTIDEFYGFLRAQSQTSARQKKKDNTKKKAKK